MLALPVELTAPALFLAGATTSLHCALMCGAINAAQVRSHGPVPLAQTLTLVHAGRVLGYALLGALAGALGAQLTLWLPRALAGTGLQVLAAFALVAAGLQQLGGRRLAPSKFGDRPLIRPSTGAGCHARGISGLSPNAFPPRVRLFAQGLLWALMPCGILYTVVLLAALTGNAIGGFVLLGAFGLGTVPLMGVSGGLFGLATRPQDTRWLRHAAGAVLIVLGVAGMAAALYGPRLLQAWCQP